MAGHAKGATMCDAHRAAGNSCFFCEAAWEGISRSLRLSNREVEILQCLVLGDSERGAACLLGLRPRTVRTHLERVRRKLGVHTRAELIVQLCDAHVNWLSQASPPLGCRLSGRLAAIQDHGTIRGG